MHVLVRQKQRAEHYEREQHSHGTLAADAFHHAGASSGHVDFVNYLNREVPAAAVVPVA